MSISINKITGHALHCRYDSQTNAQPCYIELDCKTETLSASYSAEIGNAVPFSVWHGHEQRWGIPCLTAAACNALLDEIAPLAERVIAGYESVWDGNNRIASFSAGASDAIDAIQALCDGIDEDEALQEWDVGDWMNNSPRPDAETSDETLDKMIEESEPDEENIVIHGDIEEDLDAIRYEKRRDAIEEILDDMDAVSEYKNERDDDENPDYLVRWENGRCATVKYDTAGKIVWSRSPLRPDDLSVTAMGRAYCDVYFQTKPAGGTEPRRRPIEPATDYDAARCDAVPEPYKSVCKQESEKSLLEMVRAQWNTENAAHLENKKIRDESIEKIAELERQIKSLKKTMPDEIEAEYFSMGTNSAACQYRNLAGRYPSIQ